MRRLALAAAFVWLCAPPALPAEFDIEAYCRTLAQSVGRSSAIVEGCLRSEETAKREVGRTQVEPRILAYCTGIARFLGGSYGVLKGCVDEEQAAKAALVGREVEDPLVVRCRTIANSAGGSYIVERTCIERALAGGGGPPIPARETPARHGAKPDESGNLRASVEAYCAELWPGARNMQGRCAIGQLEAQTALADLLEKHPNGSEERAAVWRCLDNWPAPQGGYDYRMAVACAEGEIKAYQAARQ